MNRIQQPLQQHCHEGNFYKLVEIPPCTESEKTEGKKEQTLTPLKTALILLILLLCTLLSSAQYRVNFRNYRTLPADTAELNRFIGGVLSIPSEERLAHIDSLKNYYAKQGAWIDYHFYTNELAFQLMSLRNYSEAADLLQEALPLLRNSIDTLTGEYLLTMDCLYQSLYFSKGADGAINEALDVYRLALQRPQIDSIATDILTSISGVLAMASHFSEAYHALQIARNKALEEDWSFYKYNIPVFMGFTALMEGKNDAAKVFYQEAIAQNRLSTYSDSTFLIYSLEGLIYQLVRKDDYENVVAKSELGLKVNETLRRTRQFPGYSNSYTNFNSFLLKTYLNTGREVEAKEIFTNLHAIESAAQNYGKLIQLVVGYGQSHQNIGNAQQAYASFLRAKCIADSTGYNNTKFRSEIFQGLSETRYLLADYALATEFAHQGLLMLSADTIPVDPIQLPRLNFMQNSSSSVKLFLCKLLAMYKWYDQQPSETQFDAIMLHFNDFEGQVHSLLSSSNDAIFIEEIQMHYKRALDGLIDLFARHKTSPLVSQSTEFLIKTIINSKATLLRQKILEQNMVRALQGQQDIFSKYHEVRREIFFTTNRRKLAESNNNEGLVREYTSKLATLYAQGLVLENEIKKAASQLTDLASLSLVDDVQYVMGRLGDHEALLEYHQTPNTLLSVCLTNQNYSLDLRPLGNLNTLISDILRGAKTGQQLSAKPDVYESLLEPHLDMLTNRSKLIIIPDDNLALMPFELIVGSDNSPQIKRYSFVYNYASSLWAMSREENLAKPSVRSMLAVAPVFDTPSATVLELTPNFQSHFTTDTLVFRSNTLAGLPQSGEEIIALKGMVQEQWGIDVDLLLHSQATKDRVMQSLSRADIVHIATHGLVDRSNPFVSGLAMYPGSEPFGANDIFFHYELYGMELNADLVVLSACNTGVGSIAEGEGILSIPRGFIFSGVPNVVASMWKVHDEKTKHFMIEFYRHLLGGKQYHEALRLAKLHFMEIGYLPLDWAGFVILGN